MIFVECVKNCTLFFSNGTHEEVIAVFESANELLTNIATYELWNRC